MAAGIGSVISATLPQLAVAGASAGGAFGIVKWFAEFFSKRADARADRLDADTRFVIENLRAEFSRVSTRMAAAEDHITDLREKLILCESKHGQSEAQVAKLTALLEGYAQLRTEKHHD
jgi:uncharacterized protein (DUF2342 family)